MWMVVDPGFAGVWGAQAAVAMVTRATAANSSRRVVDPAYRRPLALRRGLGRDARAPERTLTGHHFPLYRQLWADHSIGPIA